MLTILKAVLGKILSSPAIMLICALLASYAFYHLGSYIATSSMKRELQTAQKSERAANERLANMERQVEKEREAWATIVQNTLAYSSTMMDVAERTQNLLTNSYNDNISAYEAKEKENVNSVCTGGLLAEDMRVLREAE